MWVKSVDIATAPIKATIRYDFEGSDSVYKQVLAAVDANDTDWVQLVGEYAVDPYPAAEEGGEDSDSTPTEPPTAMYLFVESTDETASYIIDEFEILPPDPVVLNKVWLEAECGEMGADSLWSIEQTSTDSSNDAYIELTDPNGANNNDTTPSSDESATHFVSYVFDIDTAGDYKWYGRSIAANGDNDSYYIQVNDGTFDQVTTGESTEWAWHETSTYSLAAGQHTVNVIFREDGLQLDKFLVGDEEPTGQGSTAGNCN